MDKEFMEEYYTMKFNDPVSELELADSEYLKMRMTTFEEVDKLECRLQAINQELAVMLNQMLDDLEEKYVYIVKKAYLQGAIDRERMLK